MNQIAAVLVGHLLGDWVVQTDWQAANKTKSWKANQQHMLGYHITLFLFVVWSMPFLLVCTLLSVSWVTHSLIDRRWPVKRILEATQSKPFAQTTWGVLVVDQVLHISILLTIAGLV